MPPTAEKSRILPPMLSSVGEKIRYNLGGMEPTIIKRQIFCTFPQDLIKEPLLFTLGTQFQVIPNIRGASVTDEVAILSLELEGNPQGVELAITYLKEMGVKVEHIED